jgi:pimeloyl-ACP methyl ester carboxylesterase
VGAHRRPSKAVAAWEAVGTYRTLAGYDVFTAELGPTGPERHEPLLVLHGFPTSSYDFHLVVDALSADRRVLLLDMVGFGLSEKPDIAYGFDLHADVVEAFVAEAGVERLALITHDMGDTVGGELLARALEGRWPVDVTRRVLTNGSIYIDMAHLSDGQQFLLALPDEMLPEAAGVDGSTVRAGLRATFSPRCTVDEAELDAAWDLISLRQGHLLLPRTIRYIEERRGREGRFTGAIESHPSPLGVVWGVDDPIAVLPMVERLAGAVPDASRAELPEVGHYPMIEAPELFLDAVLEVLG